MKMKRQFISAVVTTSLLSFSVFAANTVTPEQKIITEKLSKLDLGVVSVEASPMKGVFEVVTNGGVLYSNSDASYFVYGQLFELSDKGPVNLTELTQAKRNAELFKSSGIEKEQIVFPAKDEKFVINVFTDTSCGYCVKLHREIEEYNNRGITVRYIAYPRSGERSPNLDQMATIWCAEDKKAAMHQAKTGKLEADKNVKAECKDLIRRHMKLGADMGVTGTPAIMLEDGFLISGYVPADRLVEILNAKK